MKRLGTVPPLKRLGSSGLPSLVPEEEDDEKSRTDQTGILAPISIKSAELPRLTVMTGTRAGLVISLTSTEFLIGRGKDTHLRLDDPGVSRHHSKIVRTGAGRFLLEDTRSTNGTLLNGTRVTSMALERGDRIQIGPDVVLQFSLFDEAEEQLARRLYDASTRDPLTDAYNRRFMVDRLQAEVSYAKRHRTPLVAIMVDLDHFKRVNDDHGHACGDVVLRAVSGRIGQMIRTEDTFSRHGGEEFLILARSSLEEGSRFAERLRRGIAALAIPFEQKIVQVTVSLGVAEFHECKDVSGDDAFVHLADKRLYTSKKAGRNRVVSA